MRNLVLEKGSYRALAAGIRIIVQSMGPRQRADVARKLTEEAGRKHEGASMRLLLKLALYVRP